MVTPVPLADQVACVERELAMRRRTYPRWVELGRMKQDAADREIARMEAVRATLMRLSQTPAYVLSDGKL